MISQVLHMYYTFISKWTQINFVGQELENLLIKLITQLNMKYSTLTAFVGISAASVHADTYYASAEW